MKGKIKFYNQEKGFGFIQGEDMQSYFFHISQVNTFEDVKQGLFVTFQPSQNQKGKCAENVVIQNETSNKQPTFIQLGNKRIKIRDIKAYGVSKGQHSVPFSQFYEVRTKELGIGLGESILNLASSFLDGSWKYQYEEDTANLKDTFLFYADDNVSYKPGDTLPNGRVVTQCTLKKGYYFYRITVKQNEKCKFGSSFFFHGRDTKTFEESPDSNGHFKSKLPYVKGQLLDEGEVIACELVQEKQPREYLYVTTRHGDNYRFYENVREYKLQLDKILL